MPRHASVEALDVKLTIEVKVNRFGHDKPYENGTPVTFEEHLSGLDHGLTLRAPGYEKDPATGLPSLVKLSLKSVGIVMGHDWFVDDYVNNISISNGKLKSRYQQHYLVMWPEGMMWSRYDWLVEIAEKALLDAKKKEVEVGKPVVRLVDTCLYCLGADDCGSCTCKAY